MLEYDVVDYLETDATLSNYLSATSDDPKIYPDIAPQNSSEPYIIFSSGIGMLDEILDEDMIQFKIYSSDKLNCTNIRNRIKTLLDKQDEIQSLITSTNYWIYYSKLTGGDITSIELDKNFFLSVLNFNIKFKNKQ